MWVSESLKLYLIRGGHIHDKGEWSLKNMGQGVKQKDG